MTALQYRSSRPSFSGALLALLVMLLASLTAFSPRAAHAQPPAPSAVVSEGSGDLVDPASGTPQTPLTGESAEAPAAAIAPAAVSWQWFGGVTTQQYGLNCSIIGQQYYEPMVATSISYLGTTPDSVPFSLIVGERYWGAIHFGVVGNPCGLGFADVATEVVLPPSTFFAIDANNPIKCYGILRDGRTEDLTNANWTSPVDGSTGPYCKATPTAGVYGGWNLGFRLVGNGQQFRIVFPMVSTKQLKGMAGPSGGDRLRAVISSGVTKNFTEFPSPAVPQVFVNVAPNPPTIDYPTPSSSNVTETAARTTGNVRHHFTAGNAFFDIGTTTAYGISTNAIALAGQYDYYTGIAADWSGLTPGTTYHWRLRFVGSDGITYLGADQTFTTAGTATYQLTLSPATGGQVTANPNQTVFTPGSSVQLTATPAAGYVFRGWQIDGADAGNANPRTLTMDRNHTVEARFAQLRATTDFDGDGKSDLLWRNTTTGANQLWLMNGATRTTAATLAGNADRAWQVAGIDDFDGDGKADILWRYSANGGNQIWSMNGTTRVRAATIPRMADLQQQVVGTGDFDGNGKADILWRNMTTGANIMWLMDGATRVAQRVTVGIADLAWKVAGTSDFNGDGKTDILWRNATTGVNSLWLMDGATRISGNAVLREADVQWQIEGTGDHNADGKADILWHHATTGANRLWLMNGATRTSTTTLASQASLDWSIVGTGDQNGDTKADIVWRNTTTGDNQLWTMNGATRLSATAMPRLADAAWQVVGQ